MFFKPTITFLIGPAIDELRLKESESRQLASLPLVQLLMFMLSIFAVWLKHYGSIDFQSSIWLRLNIANFLIRKRLSEKDLSGLLVFLSAVV